MGAMKIKKSICRSLPTFFRLGFVIVCALFWFAIIGVQAYAETFNKQCIFMDHDAGLYKFSNRVCGGYIDSDGKKHSPVVGSSYFIDHSFTNSDYYSDILEHPDQINSTSLSVRGYICPVQSYCVFSNSPVAVNLSFDNVWKSLQLLFIFFCASNYSDYLYNLIDSVSIPLATIFVVPAILILGVFMKNILVACILDTMSIYDEYRTEEDNAKYTQNIMSYYENRSTPVFLCDGFCCLMIFISLVMQMIKQSTHSDCIIINSIVAVVLFFDILIRLSNYKKDFFHRYLEISLVDTLVAIVNIIILIPPISNKTEVYKWCTFFQIVRTYRMIMFVPFLRDMWVRLLGNLHFLGYLFTFAILLFYSTSVIYSRFFEGIVYNQQILDSNLFTFSSLPNVILSLFTIMTTDNWTSGWSVAYSSSNRSSIRAFTFIYIAVWFFVGAIMLVSFFLDLITENLGDVSDKERKLHQVMEFCLKATKQRSPGKEKLAIYDVLANDEDPSQNFDLDKVSEMLHGNYNLTKYLETSKERKNYIERLKMFNSRIKFFPDPLLAILNNIYAKMLRRLKIDGAIITPLCYNCDHEARKKKKEDHKSHALFKNSLFFITPNNPVRRFIQYIVPNFCGQRESDLGKDMETPRWRDTRAPFIFEVLISLATIMMIVTTCIFTPIYCLEHDYKLGEWNLPAKFDLFYCIVFSLESCLHIIADGCFFTPTAVFKDKWGVITLATVASLWIDFAIEFGHFKYAAQYVIGLKSLRAFRLLTISKYTRDLIDSTLLTGLHSFFTAGILSMTIIIPYAVWGCSALANRLDTCNDASQGADGCYGDWVNNSVMCTDDSNEFCGWQILSPRAYSSPEFNFDTFGNSLITLVRITAIDSWTDLLDQVMNSTGIGQPVSNTSNFSMNAVFVVGFIFLAILIISNVFLSAMLNDYARLNGSAYLSDYQLSWRCSKNYINSVKPVVEPKKEKGKLGSLRKFLYNMFVEPSLVPRLVHWLVYLLLAGGLLYDDVTSPGKHYKNIIAIIATFFLSVRHVSLFFVGSQNHTGINLIKSYGSVILSMGSFGLALYDYYKVFGDKSVGIRFYIRRVDIVQKVLLCIFFIFLANMTPKLGTFIRFSIASSKQLLPLILLWVVVMLCYAIAMNQIFGMTKFGGATDNNKNFRNISNSMLVLFNMCFGEGWNNIMADFTLESPGCSSSVIIPYGEVSDCGGFYIARFMFISWNIISMYLLMNILVSIIVEAFSVTYHKNNDLEIVINGFKDCWKKYDTQGTAYIPESAVDALLNDFAKRQMFACHEETFNSWVKEDFRVELKEKGVLHKRLHFHSTLTLLCYYNYYADQKHYLRKFDEYIWRTYINKKLSEKDSKERKRWSPLPSPTGSST
ncbi:unnamed protein product [Ambrosiozyma monospora]|uniref:Calcium-channel protein CCH1 n=1 Tax=Ambrosiozyma monospora TaxID=43982 RepID=A0A9W6YXU6_AMBMO|nr:unnamed protein product [Ambrosiozyma monospora]